jgi:hypothetical protein
MDPSQRFALDEAERRANDHWRDPARTITRSPDGRTVLVDGRPIGDQAPTPGEQQPAPATDKNVVRFGNDVEGWQEASSEQIREWQATHSVMESRRLNAPADPSGYTFELSKNFVAPAGYENWKPDPNHPASHGARQLAHDIDAGRVSGQQALTRMIELNASSQIGTSLMLEKARNAEIAKLGANGSLRVTAVQDYIHSVVGPELFKQTQSLLATAAMVQVWEKVMARAGGIGGSSFSGARPAPRSESVDEKTWNSWSYSQKMEYARQHSGGGGRR